MESQATDVLDLPSLPTEALPCHKFHEIKEPLISVKRLVESGCSVHFIGEEVLITDARTGEARLRGQFSPQRSLYTIPLHEERKKEQSKPAEELPTYAQPQLKGNPGQHPVRIQMW